MASKYTSEPVLIADESGIDGLQIADRNSVGVRPRPRRRVFSIGHIVATQPTLDITPDVDWALVA